MRLQIGEEPRHGCDDSSLFLTYFELPFDVACALLEFFDVTTGNSSCSQAFSRCSLCICTPIRNWAGGCEECSVQVAVLLPRLDLHRLVREPVSCSTWIKDGLILGLALVEHVPFLFTFLQEGRFLAQKQVSRELVISYTVPAVV